VRTVDGSAWVNCRSASWSEKSRNAGAISFPDCAALETGRRWKRGRKVAMFAVERTRGQLAIRSSVFFLAFFFQHFSLAGSCLWLPVFENFAFRKNQDRLMRSRCARKLRIRKPTIFGRHALIDNQHRLHVRTWAEDLKIFGVGGAEGSPVRYRNFKLKPSGFPALSRPPPTRAGRGRRENKSRFPVPSFAATPRAGNDRRLPFTTLCRLLCTPGGSILGD